LNRAAAAKNAKAKTKPKAKAKAKAAAAEKARCKGAAKLAKARDSAMATIAAAKAKAKAKVCPKAAEKADGAAPPATAAPGLRPFGETASDTCFCQTCGSEVSLANSRIVSKRMQEHRCNGCNSKVSILSRARMWPPAQAVPKEHVAAFMKDCASNKRALVAGMNKLVKRFETHSQFYENGGEWLPLGVWGARGYDMERIEKNTPKEHKKLDPQVGVLYRVRVFKEGERGEKGSTSEQQIDAAFKRQRLSAASVNSLAEKLSKKAEGLDDKDDEKTAEGNGDESSESLLGSSSDFSEDEAAAPQLSDKQMKLLQAAGCPIRAGGSSSARGSSEKEKTKEAMKRAAQKEKEKDARKATRDAEKLQRIAKRAEDKKRKDKEELAQLVLDKVPDALLVLQAAFNDPGLNGMAENFMKPAKEQLEKFRSLVTAAKREQKKKDGDFSCIDNNKKVCLQDLELVSIMVSCCARRSFRAQKMGPEHFLKNGFETAVDF